MGGMCLLSVSLSSQGKMRTRNERKILSLYLLSLIVVGPFLVFSLKWLSGEPGDCPVCIIKEMLLLWTR